MSRQLPLDLPADPASGRADFLPAEANRDALAMLDQPARWPQGRLLLIGPEGAGKSHLAGFWAAERGIRPLAATDLDAAGADRLASQPAAVVEDVQHAAGTEAERALFHLWNLAPLRGCLLLMTGRGAPSGWGLGLADLRSRLEATAQVRLGPPDEALLAAVLVKLFADRQLSVPAGLIGWLARHMDRDLGLARRLVATLDARALAEGGAPTRRMAAEILDKLMAGGASSPASIPTQEP